MRTLIHNLGDIVSGNVEAPRLAGDTVLVEDGRIAAIAARPDFHTADTIIDAGGMTLAPGLIDSHAHPVLGDWHPRQNVLGWIESGLHAGVTTIISAGAAHMPGRPSSPAGVVAMAVLAGEAYRNFRPAGVKVEAGVLIPAVGLEPADFAYAAKHGVTAYGEVGYGDLDIEEAVILARYARAAGLRVIMHCGGASHVGALTAALSTRLEDVLRVQPDVVSHLNGGTTAIPAEEAVHIVRETAFPFDLVIIGNPRVFRAALTAARDGGQCSRVMFGTDAPAGFGMIPMGIGRLVVEAASLYGIDPAVAWAMGSGNASRIWGLAQGCVEVGRPADLLLIDAPTGSAAADGLSALAAGDLPHIGCVLVDGRVRACPARNAPSGKRRLTVKGQ